MSRNDLLQAVWFGGIAVVVIFVLGLAAWGGRWRRRGANAIAGRNNSAKGRLNQ